MIKRRRHVSAPKPLSAAAIRAIQRRGVAHHGIRDLYFNLLTMPLVALIGVLALYLLALNFLFTWVYFIAGGLGGGLHGRFATAFFFSVETLSTTGYGSIYPVSLTANLIASGEMVLGQLNTALATGVLFARLSRPQPRVLFSRVMVLRTVKGVRTLMFRVVNERRSMISEASINVVMNREEDDGEGGVLRSMLPLKLEQDFTPVLGLSWTVQHKITPDSPLWGIDTKAMMADGSILICSLTGTDEGLNAGITARHVYGPDDLRRGERFVDIISHAPDGRISIDYSRFHDTEPVQDGTAHA